MGLVDLCGDANLRRFKQPATYIVVGLVSTAVTVAIIFLLLAGGLSIVLSNVVGYAGGLVASFSLNSLYTFRSRMHAGALARFLLTALVAYLGNLVVLFIVFKFTSNEKLATVAGMPVYTVIGYLLNKYWALAERS